MEGALKGEAERRRCCEGFLPDFESWLWGFAFSDTGTLVISDTDAG